MKRSTIHVVLAAALAAFVAPALAALLTSCAGSSPWLRPQGELLQLERQAAAALDLASEPRTRAALQLCVTSAQGAVRAIDVLLGAKEKLRQAKKEGAAIPELERSVARATTDAEDTEAQARVDCRRAGVSRAPGRAEPADGGAGAAEDAVVTAHDSGGAAADMGPAPARDLAPVSMPSPHQPPPAPPAPAPADGGAR